MVVNEHFDAFAARMVGAYKSLKIGSPLDKDVLVGPLHSKAQIKQFTEGIAEAQRQGGKLLCGGDVLPGPGNYVTPAIIEISADAPIVQTEIFAPILYMHRISGFEEAV